MILLIDHDDSFTYNIYQFISAKGYEIEVINHRQVTIDTIEKRKPSAIILSSGPGLPDREDIGVRIVQTFYQQLPILGICRGHQAIGFAFGGKVVKAKTMMHGKTSMILHTGESIFAYIQQPFQAMRYHSFVLEKKNLPQKITVLAKSMEDEEIMAIKHQKYPVYGLQFHPDSIGTKVGNEIIQHFLQQIERGNQNERSTTKTN